MPIYNVHEAKTHFSRLLEAAAAGHEVVIAKAGKPVAKVIPYPDLAASKSGRSQRKLGILGGKLNVPADFDDPLPDEILAAFEGR